MRLQDNPEFSRNLRQLVRLLSKITRQLTPEPDSPAIPPTFLLDQLIIANARLAVLPGTGFAAGDPGLDLPPFECGLRGYLIQYDASELDGFVVASLTGEAAIDEDVVEAIVDSLEAEAEEHFEYWLLEDDEVVDYWEWGEEDEASSGLGGLFGGLLDGRISCGECGSPMVAIGEDYMCARSHLMAEVGAPVFVRDIIPEPLTLVFSNGTILPLLCAECGDPYHTTDDNAFLETVTGLSIVGIDWHEGSPAIEVLFGREPDLAVGEIELADRLTIHIDSVKLLQPGKRSSG